MEPIHFNGLNHSGERKSATILRDDVAVGSFVYLPTLEKLGFTCLCLAMATPVVSPPHLRFPLIDGTGNNDDQIWRCVDFVTDIWQAGGKAAVLCRSGANRSPAILAASLYVANRATSIFGAIEWMRGKRKEVGHYKDTTSEIEFAIGRRVKVIRENDAENPYQIRARVG